jgi:hypothetical protein
MFRATASISTAKKQLKSRYSVCSALVPDYWLNLLFDLEDGAEVGSSETTVCLFQTLYVASYKTALLKLKLIH